MQEPPAGPLLDAIVAVERADRFAVVRDAVRQAAHPFGFDRFVLFSARYGEEPSIDRILWIEGDWFADGTAPDAESYVRHCPVTDHVMRAREPFFWSKTGNALGKRYRITGAPRGTGLHGLQVPVFGPAGLDGAMSLGGKRIDTRPAPRLLLPVLATAAFRAATRLLLPPVEPDGRLSAREREVLGWIAAGRRQAAIAAALGLSGRTVENHLRRIRQRLGVSTTAQAVRVALRDGQLER